MARPILRDSREGSAHPDLSAQVGDDDAKDTGRDPGKLGAGLAAGRALRDIRVGAQRFTKMGSNTVSIRGAFQLPTSLMGHLL